MQIITHTEPWVLVSLGMMYIILLSILISSLWDLITGKRREEIRQEIFFDRYMDVIDFTVSAGPLIGLFSTNSLGSYALQKAGPILSGSNNGSSQMGEMFNAIAGAMSATSLGIGVALMGFTVSLVCRWIYDVEPLTEPEKISGVSMDGKKYLAIWVSVKQVLEKIYPDAKKVITQKEYIDTKIKKPQVPTQREEIADKYKEIPLSKSEE